MTHLRVVAIVGKRGSRDRAEKLGAIVVPGGKAKISDVHLVQVHVPRDGLRLEGPGVHGAAGLQLGLAAAGLDRVRDGAVEVGLGADALARP